MRSSRVTRRKLAMDTDYSYLEGDPDAYPVTDEEIVADLFMGAIIVVVLGSAIILLIGWFLGLVARVFMKGLGR